MMKKFAILVVVLLLVSCNPSDDYQAYPWDNPELSIEIPAGFPALNPYVSSNKPTKYGVELGYKLFHEKRLSADNSISCASCHMQSSAFADHNPRAIGIKNRVGLRNTPPIQNLMFVKFFNWDGNVLRLEKQPLVPIITHEEMDSSIVEVIEKIEGDSQYKELFKRAFGDESISPLRIYNSIAQYEYTLISANSKYDRVRSGLGEKFTERESRGYELFQQKCISCHSGELFSDQSFRNIGFPRHTDSNETGRARVTGVREDYMRFRVPSLRNIEYTAPYGSFGQFPTLLSLLDYLDAGVLDAENLDPILKQEGNRIPLSAEEKQDLIAFMKTLSDQEFVGRP